MNQSQMIPPTDTITADAVAAAQATIAAANRQAAEAYKLKLQREAAERVRVKAEAAANRERLETAIEVAVRDNDPGALSAALKEAKPLGLGAGYLKETVRYRPAFLKGVGITEFHDANRVEPTGLAQWYGREVAHPLSAAWDQAAATCGVDDCTIALEITHDVYTRYFRVDRGHLLGRTTECAGIANHMVSTIDFENELCDKLFDAGNPRYVRKPHAPRR